MWAALVLALVLAAAQRADAPPPRVRYLPPVQAFAMDDERITYTLQVDPRPAHRVLVLSAWEDGVSVRASVVQLDGDQAHRTHRLTWYPMPAGVYTVIAVVYGTAGEFGRATTRLTVRARWGED